MDLMIFAGFLGSGKTTLILPIAKDLVEKGRKLVIIENEVGKIGVDDRYLQQEGLNVRELYSGCICCQLRVDLLNTLYEIERTIDPDVVIMEPSGVASPAQVLQGLVGYGGNIDRKRVIFLIDAIRFKAIELLSLPLVETGVECADIVAINKIDGVSEQHLDLLRQRIETIKPHARIICVSAMLGTNMHALSEAIGAEMSGPRQEAPPKPVSTEEIDKPVPTVHARKVELSFSPPVASDRLADEIAARLGQFSQDLQNGGCTLIGHIKVILQPREGGYLLFNLTNFGETPRRRGGVSKSVAQATLTLNAIVYGLDQITLYEKAEGVFARQWA